MTGIAVRWGLPLTLLFLFPDDGQLTRGGNERNGKTQARSKETLRGHGHHQKRKRPARKVR